ncbi:MAG: hypothetical protein WAL98_02350 [Desulfatiglandaceae bacterium]|jgi:hypothetical protein
MNNEGNGGIGPNLTLLFRRFLTTPEGMGVHAGVECQVPHEKASEKDPQVLLMRVTSSLEVSIPFLGVMRTGEKEAFSTGCSS